MDNAWLARVLGPDPLAPCPVSLLTEGTYCIDYAATKIFLGTDPAGHTVTYSGDDGTGQLLQFAFERTTTTDKLAQAVSLMKLSVEQYANTDPATSGVTPAGGAVVQMSDGWVLDNVDISRNHGVGLGLGGDAWTVSNTTLSYNGKSGCGGPSSNGTFGPNNTVTYNNQDFFNVVWGAGAGKMSGAGPITIFASTFSHNLGNGLWFDAGYHNALVTGNTMVGNTAFPPGDGQHGGDGIRVEISCFITITNNVVMNNDRVGINLNNSHDVTVGGVGAGNTLSGNGDGGVQIAYHGRTGTGFCSPLSSKNNHVINNAMTMSGTDSVGVQVNAACIGCVTGTLFTGNTYTGGYCSDLLWEWWDGSIQHSVNFSTWKSSYKQDATGWCEGISVPPTINGLSPTSGVEQGGQCTVISGSDFQSGATVTFGPSQGILDAPIQPTQITVDLPPGIGTVDLTVTNPDGGTATAPGAYSYSGTLTGPSPALGVTPGAAGTPGPGFDVFNTTASGTLEHTSWACPPGWSDVEDLGGSIASGPSASSMNAPQLQVFAQGTNNSLMENARDANGVWSGWTSLGGILVTRPTAVSWGPGRIDVFARGTDARLWHKWFAGGKWSGWQNLMGVLPAGSSPTATSTAPGLLQVFTRGLDNAVWKRTWNGKVWSGWVSMHGVIQGDLGAAAPTAHKLQLFVRGLDNALWIKTLADAIQSGWSSLGGTITSSPAAASATAGSNPAQTTAFALAEDDTLWYIRYTGTDWSAWAKVP
jgi:hypothetical protein